MKSTEIKKTDYVYFNTKTNKLHFFNTKISKEPFLIIDSNMETNDLIACFSEDIDVLVNDNGQIYHYDFILEILNEKIDKIFGIAHILDNDMKIIKTSKGIFILNVKTRIKIKI